MELKLMLPRPTGTPTSSENENFAAYFSRATLATNFYIASSRMDTQRGLNPTHFTANDE